MHAAWNAVLKIRLDPFLAMTLINITGGIIALPVLIYTGLPDAASWPWAALSLTLHMAYYTALSEAYRRADMSVVYPVARGSAPLLTTLTATLLLGETLNPTGIAGILILAFGILIMTWQPGKTEKADPLGLLFAGLTAIIISGYSISDGLGARASGNAIAFSALLLVFNGLIPAAIAWVARGLAGFTAMRAFILPGFAGGVMSVASYTIAVWAMTRAPIPLVAAVRETSVLFAMAIAVLILGEPLRWNRLAAATLIVGGLLLIRL